jgi:hypothetical protein
MLTLKSVNKEIRKINPNFTLYQGKGYLYIVYDDKKTYDDISIAVCKLNHGNIDIYLESAKELNQKVIEWYNRIGE